MCISGRSMQKFSKMSHRQVMNTGGENFVLIKKLGNSGINLNSAQCALSVMAVSEHSLQFPHYNLFYIQHVICHLQLRPHETKVYDLWFCAVLFFSPVASFKVSRFKQTHFSSVNSRMHSQPPRRGEPVGCGEPMTFPSAPLSGRNNKITGEL